MAQLNQGNVSYPLPVIVYQQPTIKQLHPSQIRINPVNELGDFVDDLQDSNRSISGSYKTGLPALAYLGGNYYFRPSTCASFIVNPRFYNGNTDMAFSLGLQHRVNRWLQAVVNYSTYNKTGGNLGAGLSLNLGGFQIYAASDNILPIFNLSNARNAQVNAGINLTFGRKTRAQQLAEWKGEDADSLNVEAIAEAEIEETEPVAELPKVKKEKPQRTPKQKPVKEKPVATEPAPAPIAEEIKPYVTILGSVKNSSTDAPLEGIAVDVYHVLPGGTEQTSLLKSFLNGQINISLEREKTYRIVVRKLGYLDQEIQITPAEMEGVNTLEKQFALALAPPPAPIEKPAATTPKPQPATDAPATTGKPVQTKPAPTAAPAKTGDRYIVTEATSFREGASHETKAILRFPAGAKVIVVDRSNELWWRVRYLGRVGYVKAALLEPNF